ncbi:conserved hypothetical protein [Vibrio nigripulchritudo MADA3029]|uniref:DUF1127 domain-containing protein n=1 Tax=Vibrio nigripulchritudo TaxID=28173 RepID=U4K1K8_9VIBR|nr:MULTISPECIES: hypothetical protein [Vibrio]EGU61917.1 hypothetical protein VINI7043_28885 [Vibrio nigripulchritudo ATCC 27043]KJY72439.1 hypothetical protein TW74_22015 [Vibrio nigripulchritudo]UAB70920.1 DUF1127 domain-containing protein [Vibrio sp. SCSIO 43132]CCN38402.1 conserved hypothetical protein [Vibrio nigripulchritudo AM115]CCN41325.1 conserved hypothetical protein [Vibrio nigripulchritudo FTn2]
MRHSIYIQLATLLVKADIKREERAWKRRVARAQQNIPWHNAHLLQDIGLDPDGRLVGANEQPSATAERRVRHLRRLIRTRIPT